MSAWHPSISSADTVTIFCLARGKRVGTGGVGRSGTGGCDTPGLGDARRDADPPWNAGRRDDEPTCGGTEDRACPPDGAPLDGDTVRLDLDAGTFGCTDLWRGGLRPPRPVSFWGDGDGDERMPGRSRRAWDDYQTE